MNWHDHFISALIVGIFAFLQQRGIVSPKTVLFWSGVFVCLFLSTVIWYVKTQLPNPPPAIEARTDATR